MDTKRVGVLVGGTNPAPLHAADVLAGIVRAEELGISAAWLVTGSASIDPLTLLASAIMRTSNILLGTCIVTTFPRHPVVVAQQVQVIDHLAPDRFRLGVGPGHRNSQVATYGVNFHTPLGHLREYLRISKALLQEGSVQFDGSYYQAHASIVKPVNVPVMASALQPKSFDLCGEDSDGAISWICPQPYLRDVALPAMAEGAQRAGRPVPPLIEMVPVSVHENADEVREAIRGELVHPRLPFYQRMFAAAGFPEASEGKWSDAMIDATACWGEESRVAEELESLFTKGTTEVMAVPILAGSDKAASLDRTLRLLAQVSRAIAP